MNRSPKSLVAPGTVWDVTNHFIKREDHPCFGTNRRTIVRVTATRAYYAAPYQHDGEAPIEWPAASRVVVEADGSIRLLGKPMPNATDTFLTLTPVAA